MRILSVLTFVVLLCGCSFARAQELHPQWRNFTVKEGLPSIETYDVLQDSKGYIWIGTDAGVARYDGYSFKNFTSKDGLSDNTVFGILEDRYGKIWFRTFNGGVSYYHNDSIYQLPCNKKLRELRKEGIFTSMHIDSHDTIWLGGIMQRSPLRLVPPRYDSVLLPPPVGYDYSNYISVIENTPICGINYLYGKPQLPRLTIFDGARYKGHLYFDGSMIKASWQHLNVHRRRNGSILLATGMAIVEVFPGDTAIIREQDERVISFYEDKENNLWVGFYKKGVLFYEGGDLSKPPLKFLPNRSVTSIHQDKEGSYWITTLEEGLFMTPGLNFLTYKIPGISLHNKTTRVLPDNDDLWISLGDTGIALIQERNSKLFMSRNEKIGQILNLIKLRTGEIIGRGTFSTVEIKEGKWHVNKNIIYARIIYPRSEGGYWQATPDKLQVIEGETITDITPLSFRADALYEDNTGALWIGSSNGLCRYVNGKLEEMNHLHPVLKNRIVDIKMRGNEMWLATRGSGVILLTPDTVLNITSAMGLASDISRSLCFDNTGSAWLGTSKGISRLRTLGNYKFEIRNYTALDGLVSDDVRQVASAGDNVYVATTSGITKFSLKDLSPNEMPPPIHINRIEVNEKLHNAGDRLELEHHENYVNFYFTGLSYKVPGSIRYMYQLEGVDEDWKTTSSTYVEYTTLPPGTYTFRVYALNNDGVKSLAPAVIHITINKPFWATWWFIALCVIFVVTITFLVVVLRERAIRKRELEKMELTQKMSDLELKSIRAQMNPHFIFNALNSIQRFVLENDSLSAQKYLTKFARLIRNVLSNSRTEMILLAKEIETLKIYVEIESLRFGEQFTYAFEVDEEVDENNLLVPSMFMQPYLENAIWHGLMHKQDNRMLSVRIYIENEKLICEVEDNGVGRVHSQKFNELNNKEHESMATTLNQERIAVLNQVHQTNIQAIFTDLKDESGNPQGTRVKVEFPLIYAH